MCNTHSLCNLELFPPIRKRRSGRRTGVHFTSAASDESGEGPLRSSTALIGYRFFFFFLCPAARQLTVQMMQNPQILAALQERLDGLNGSPSGYIERWASPLDCLKDRHCLRSGQHTMGFPWSARVNETWSGASRSLNAGLWEKTFHHRKTQEKAGIIIIVVIIVIVIMAEFAKNICHCESLRVNIWPHQ